jgi:hypothetical protein
MMFTRRYARSVPNQRPGRAMRMLVIATTHATVRACGA